MSPTIEVSINTYKRLEKFAVGFDTPESVIVRLMDSHEQIPERKPELTFTPSDEDVFKRELIKSREAEVVIYKVDGSREITHWNANRFSNNSNLRGNLWSGILRDWKTKGIVKADLRVLPMGLNSPEDTTEQMKRLALELGLTYEEICELDYEVDTNESDDGQLYNYVVQFSEDCNPDILSKIEGLHDHLWVNVDSGLFDG